MVPKFGYFALWFATSFTAWLSLASFMAVQKQDTGFLTKIRLLALPPAALISLSFFSLLFSFVSCDFSVIYVASHASRELPLAYRIPAVWGGHEGSILLWVFILQLWTIAVIWLNTHLPCHFRARMLTLLSGLSTLLTLFILATSNPFLQFTLIDIPENGRDLNPLLQDPGFLWHPPTLYMGYVGLAIPFAFCVSALWEGRFHRYYAKWARPWTLLAWLFLTLGIVLGSLWAYRVLGWGGWWFWDPVENASFMPWLVATALLHSFIVSEKQGTLKGWVISLSIFGFALSLLGTFLVRSGILTSVHAFAVDPARGLYMLLIFALTIGSASILAVWRYPVWETKLSSLNLNQTFWSKAQIILMNNLLLSVMMIITLLGTLYPLAIDVLGLGKLSVGPPYFKAVMAPCMICLLLVMGLAMQTSWQKQTLSPHPQKTMLFKFALSIILGLCLPLYFGSWSWSVACMGSLGLWVMIMTISRWIFSFGRKEFQAISAMAIAHTGIVIVGLGIVISQAYSLESQIRILVGEQTSIGPYDIKLQGFEKKNNPQGYSQQATFLIQKPSYSSWKTKLYPEKRFYTLQNMGLSHPAIYTHWTTDLYLALGETLENKNTHELAHIVRIYYKPWIRLIWIGGFLIAFGGLLALIHPRYFRFLRL